MGCMASHQKEIVKQINVNEDFHDKVILNQANRGQESPEVTRVSSGTTLDGHEDIDEPNLILTNQEKRLKRLQSAAARGINLGDSLDSQLSFTFKSLTSSASSASSADSGVYELDEDYSHVITEHSESDKVRQVESEFRPKELDLCIVGHQCSRRQSAKPKNFLDEQQVLASLREEGLIARAPAKATGGLSFEVISVDALPEHNNTVVRRLPPLKVERMERRRKKKILTKETLQEKLEKADERRRQQEEEKLTKLAVRPKTAVVRDVEKMYQEVTKMNYDRKLAMSAINRNKHLNEKRTKLRVQRERSAKVRLRKILNPFPAENPIEEERNANLKQGEPNLNQVETY